MYCAWHVLKTFKSEIRSRLTRNKGSKSGLAHKVNNMLDAIRCSRSQSEARNKVVVLRVFLVSNPFVQGRCIYLSRQDFALLKDTKFFTQAKVVKNTNVHLENAS